MTLAGWWERRVRGDSWKGRNSAALWVLWPGTLWTGGGQFRTSSSGGVGLASLLHVAGESRVADTAWLFLTTEDGLWGEQGPTRRAAAYGCGSRGVCISPYVAHTYTHTHTSRQPTHTVSPALLTSSPTRRVAEMFWGLGLGFLPCSFVLKDTSRFVDII